MPRFALAMLLLAALLPGCAALRPRPAEIQVRLVNDGNRLLTVEGTSNLPEGSAIEAELREGEKRILARGRSLLRRARYCMTLDLAEAPGNHPLSLEVFFDPVSAPPNVLAQVGDDGFRLVGEQVEMEHGRQRVVERLRVVLPMEPREAALRKVARGDYAAGIAGLEKVVERDPDDAEAAAWLALAWLERSPAERRPGSEAHRMLERALGQGVPEPALSRGREWLDRLSREEALARIREQGEEARRQALARREKMAALVVPGASLGTIELGTAAGRLFAELKPDRFPAWGTPGTERITFSNGLVVDFDGATARAVRLATTSEKYRLENGLGVGSPFLAVLERYPGAQVAFGPEETGPDGTRVAHGRCVLDGLEFEVRRQFDPLGPPVDEVEGLAVVPASAASAAPALPPLGPGTAVTPAGEASPAP